MLLDAAGFEADDLRDARADQIGDSYKASIVDALDEETHALGADHRRVPRSLLVIERGELEPSSRSACGMACSVARGPVVETVLIDASHAITQCDDVVGGLPDETQGGTDQWHRDRIGRVRQRIVDGLAEAGQDIEPLAGERFLAWRIGQLVALLIECQEDTPIVV